MATRDYENTPVSDALGLKEIIAGLAGDLSAMRAGTISPNDGLARAAVAKQIFNGVRLFMQAYRIMENQARPVTSDQDTKVIEQ